VFCHFELSHAKWNQCTRNTYSNDTHAATESPGKKTWSRLGVCSHMVLAVVAGQVNRPITEISWNYKLSSYRWRSFVNWTNILAPGWRRVGPHPDGALVEAVRVCHVILVVGHGNTQGDAVAGDCHWGHDQLDIF